MSVPSFFANTCPPGTGGSKCTSATCKNPFVPPAQRTVKPTGSNCLCTDGFVGTSCNVCTSAQACKNGLIAAAATQSSTSADSALTCHQQPNAITTSYMSCKINQPTFSSLFPGDFEIELTKVNKPDDSQLTGLPHWNDQSGVTLSSVYLDGVEQFQCQATGCTEANTTTPVVAGSTSGTTEMTCNNLQCYCIPGTRVCTPSLFFDANKIINGLNGTLSMPCDYLPAGNTTGRCNFKGALLTSFLGANGLPLENCKFGSCVTQGELEQSWVAANNAASNSTSSDGGEGSVSGSVIAGLVVLATIFISLLGLGVFGWRARNRAAVKPRSASPKALGLRWDGVTYVLKPSSGPLSALMRRRRGRAQKGSEMIELGGADQSSGSALAYLDDDENDDRPVQILCGVSGELAPGSFQALLGTSGAGKSTLCDILCGRTKCGSIGGSVTLFEAGARDGDFVPSQALSKRPIAFVDQHDELPALLTVREALSFAARLSLPENVPTSEQDIIVDDVIVELGLERVANRKIGDELKRGISGGERRRVSIGLALVGQPQILVADEPLSGLDSISAEKVMSALRSRANGTPSARLSAIMSLHQPSSEQYHSFDAITLLGPGGRAIYHGTPANSIDWCEAHGEPCPRGHNVADHLLRLASGPNAHLLSAQALSRKTSEPLATDTARSSPPLPPLPASTTSPSRPFVHPAKINPVSTAYTQITTLLRRSYLTASRDPAGPLSHIVGAIGIGLLVGGAFFQVNMSIGGFQNRVGSIYFTLILMSFASMSATTVLNRTRPLMIRERASRFYQPLAFFVAHVLWDLVVLRVIPALFLMTITYWMVGLHASAKRFFEYVLIGVVYHCVMAVYDMLLGALFFDASIPVLLAGFWILFNLTFAGFLLNTSNLPSVLRWVNWIAPMKYALEAMASNEIQGLSIVDSLNGLPIDAPVETINPSLFNFQPEYYRNLLVLALAFLLGLAFLLHEAIFYRMRERR